MVFHPFLVCIFSLNTTQVLPMKASIWDFGSDRSLYLFLLDLVWVEDGLLQNAFAALEGSSWAGDLFLLVFLVGTPFELLVTHLNLGELGSMP